MTTTFTIRGKSGVLAMTVFNFADNTCVRQLLSPAGNIERQVDPRDASTEIVRAINNGKSVTISRDGTDIGTLN